MARNLKAFLSHVPMFSELIDDELDELSEYATEIKLKKGDVIFREGDKGDSFYIVKDGRIRVIKRFLREEEKSLALLGSGSVFGEMALLEDARRSATVVADTDVDIIEIPKKEFFAFSELNPSAGYKIMFGIACILSSRLRKMDEEFVGIFSHPFRSIKELESVLKRLRTSLIAIGWEGKKIR